MGEEGFNALTLVGYKYLDCGKDLMVEPRGAFLGIILLASSFKLPTNGSNTSKPDADALE